MLPADPLIPLLWVLAAVLVVVGLVGTLLPMLPGVALVFLGLVVAAWAEGFQQVGWFTLVILGLLTLLAYALDLAATALGTRRVGASRRAVWGAGLGTLVGLFFGLPGLLVGPFAGAVLGEYTVQRRLGPAGVAGAGAWLGFALGVAAKIALAFTMLGIFALAYLW